MDLVHAWLHAWLHRRRQRCSRQCCAHGEAPRVPGDVSFGLGYVSPPPRLAWRAARGCGGLRGLGLGLELGLGLNPPVLLLASGSHSRAGPAEATGGAGGRRRLTLLRFTWAPWEWEEPVELVVVGCFFLPKAEELLRPSISGEVWSRVEAATPREAIIELN